MKILIYILLFASLGFGQIQVYKSDLIKLYGDVQGTCMYDDLKKHTRFDLKDAGVGVLATATSGFFSGYWYEARMYGYNYPGTGG
ncbi:MAG: hypothetical protein ABIJ40_18930, partial [Bacteroidota bacterium]